MWAPAAKYLCDEEWVRAIVSEVVDDGMVGHGSIMNQKFSR